MKEITIIVTTFLMVSFNADARNLEITVSDPAPAGQVTQVFYSTTPGQGKCSNDNAIDCTAPTQDTDCGSGNTCQDIIPNVQVTGTGDGNEFQPGATSVIASNFVPTETYYFQARNKDIATKTPSDWSNEMIFTVPAYDDLIITELPPVPIEMLMKGTQIILNMPIIDNSPD